MRSHQIPFVLILLISQAVSQQKAPLTIKGHTIGENLSSFLSAEGQPDALANCQKLLSKHHPKSWESGDQYSPVGKCLRIVSANNGNRVEFSLNAREVTFNNSRLVRLHYLFLNSVQPPDKQVPFEKVRQDAIEKMGNPEKEGTTTWQNAMGATWHPRYAVWCNHSAVLRIDELPDRDPNALPSVSLDARSISDLEETEKEKFKGPNVLDK